MRGDEVVSATRSTVPLKSLLKKVETGWSPVCDAAPPALDEWGVLRLSAVTSGTFVPTEAKRLPPAAAPRPTFEVKTGDVLVSRANGAKALVGVACSVGNVRARLLLPDLVFRLEADNARLDSRFLGIALSSAGLRRQIDAVMRGTSGQYKISKADIQRLELPEVPLAEQRRIVAAHAAFERRIGVFERQAQKRAALVSGLVESLLRQHTNQVVKLGEMPVVRDSGITLGAHRAPRRNAVGYLRVANVRKGWIDAGDIAVLESEERDRPRYELEPGDVLVVEGHANPEQIGRAAVVGESTKGLLFQNHLFRLRFDGVIPEFAMLWLNASAVRSYWRTRCTTSSGLYTINSKLLAAVPFPRVNLEQQRKIVSAWQVANRSVDSARRQVERLRVLQAAVVEDLLTGNVCRQSE